MENELFLGMAIRAEAHWARIEPLAVRIEGQWVKIENPIEMFPSHGKVFSPRPLNNGSLNSLWTFTQRPSERVVLKGPDHRFAESIVAAIPMIDLSLVSLEVARRILFNQGVDLPLEFSPVNAVILVTGGLFCDVTLEVSPDGLWRSSSISRPVPLREVPKGWESPLEFNGLRVVPAQTIPPGPAIQNVNWCSDQDFIEHVIARFRKFMQNVGDTPYARPSRDTVKFISRALRQAELMPSDDNDSALDMERLQADWPILEARLEASEELSSLILGLKSSKEKIADAVEVATRLAIEEQRSKIERQVREEAETSLSEVRKQFDEQSKAVEELKRQRAKAEQDLAALEKQCNESREQQKSISHGLQSVAGELRTALMQSPRQDHATLAYIAERLEHMLDDCGHRGPPLVPPSIPPWGVGITRVESVEIGYDSLIVRIGEEAKRHGVEENALRLVDVFARAGELVLLCGPQAELTLQAYARCISAGVSRTMALDPSIIGLDDLWRAPGTQTPTVLAHTWQAALGEPNCFHIVCLRDIDAAPYRLWLASFQAILQGASRPPNLIVLAMTTGRSDVRTTVASRDGDMSDYLVPLSPSVHADGAVSALATTAPSLPLPSRLDIDSGVLGPSASDWLRQVVTLNLPPTALVRLAKFTNRFNGNDAAVMTAVQRWGQFLGSKEATNLTSCLKDGYTALIN